MHRPGSTNRASDEYVINLPPQRKGSPEVKQAAAIDQLPTYSPLYEVSKKEPLRFKYAENAVHFIPVVLIVCAIILWFFSHPVDVNKGASIVARIEGLMLDGDANQTQTDLPVIERELEPLERIPDDAAEGYSGMSI